MCMITGLASVRKLIDFINAGGMGTQVPLITEKLRERGVDVSMENTTGCDILHLHTPLPTYLPLIKRARKSGRKVVMHARHLPELVKGGFRGGNLIYPVFHRYSQYLYNQADAVVCATPYVKSWMETHGVRSKLYVIPNGVDCSFFRKSEDLRRQFREKHHLSESDFAVLSVGLMIPRKGIHDFVRVAERCRSTTFIWIGATEKVLEKVHVTFPENFVHIPYLPFSDMPSAYNGADVFFFPTYAESYGNVLMEAASCEKAIVLRDIEIYREWFTHGENCLKGATVDEFVQAVERLKDDHTLRESIAHAARRTAQEHDIAHTIDALMNMYEELLQEN